MLREKMSKAVKGLTAIVLAAICVAGSGEAAYAANGYGGEYYGFDLNYHESAKCEKADGWSNGDMFRNCTWRAGNVNFNDGKMLLSITNDPYGNTPYAGGEYRSKEYFGYGRYDVRMKPIKNDGVVSSFFTYTGPTDGTRWDEIDIEFLGKNTTQVQFNYYTNGVGNHEYVYNLGFDAAQSFHTYSFIWERSKITWCVDGKAVYTATRDIPVTPGKIMMNAWPGVGVDDWLKAYDGRTGLVAEYDWASYTSLSKYYNSIQNNNDSGSQAGNGLVSGKTYFINSKLNSKCLDIAYWSKDAGANIQQWDYLKQANQHWILEQQKNGYYVIRSAYSGKVLDVAWASKDAGANVQQWSDNGGAQQQWKIEPVGDAYRIINVNSGKALDIAAKSMENSGNIQQWDYNGGKNQLWYFAKIN